MATKIIAHRGASYEAPENTLIAVNLAWQLGADGVEVDVRLTKDAQIVVFHDATTRRYNGHYKQISRCTYAELHNLDVGILKGDEFRGERIPLLSQVINTIPKGKILVIEVKSGPGIVTHLKKLLDNSNLNHDLVKFISFKRDTIKMLKNKMPEYDALRIYELRQMPLLNRTIPSLKILFRH
ncbi:MAG: glycerophosphodiester phosphodiesterase family protein [Calditrichaceae bacterium]